MILVLALGILCLIGVTTAVVTSVRDSRSPAPTVWGYNTRRPLP